MKKIFLVLMSCVVFISANDNHLKTSLFYEVDMTDTKDDLFHVTVIVDGLAKENDVYNFASNVPGTYQISDFGRFVKSFQAYNKKGEELGTTRLSMNRWRIRKIDDVHYIKYTIEDTYDADIESNPIYLMSGTGIQDDFIVLNTFGVLGFFDGMQSNPIELKLKYNKNWEIGTSLRQNEKGIYIAESFDRLADSPILIGELTRSTIMVNDIEVNIHTYSTIPNLNSDFIMQYAEDVLSSAGDFIGYTPAPNYDFLFTLLNYEDFIELAPNGGGGALEHSLSSLYILTGTTDEIVQLVPIMAHEFLHILSPLNLHSEIIHNYNFKYPTPSRHIWLYEGVTEWASGIMQLQSNILSLEDYLKSITKKLYLDDMIDPDNSISLTSMSEGVFNPDTSRYFINFYNKGALTACLLDILLLELSDGQSGFKDLYLKLLNEYGKNRPFPEDNFFEIITARTYPEIKSFIDNYIEGNENLPIKEYFDKIGITYIYERPSDDEKPWFGFNFISYNAKDFLTMNLSDYAFDMGLKKLDQIVDIFGIEANGKTMDQIKKLRDDMNIGDSYEMTVLRNGEEIKLKGNLQRKIDRHIFEINSDATEEQLNLRQAWLNNN